jgi:hypothetical protein
MSAASELRRRVGAAVEPFIVFLAIPTLAFEQQKPHFTNIKPPDEDLLAEQSRKDQRNPPGWLRKAALIFPGSVDGIESWSRLLLNLWHERLEMRADDLTAELQLALDRLLAGEAVAGHDLVSLAYERLRLLAHTLLAGYDSVARWEETDDVLQNSALRLCRALESVRPASAAEFFGLAALQIRRELVDLARHHNGPEGSHSSSNSSSRDSSFIVLFHSISNHALDRDKPGTGRAARRGPSISLSINARWRQACSHVATNRRTIPARWFGAVVLLKQGRRLLGPPEPSVEAELTSIQDVERLDRMTEAILTVKSWEELLSTS